MLSTTRVGRFLIPAWLAANVVTDSWIALAAIVALQTKRTGFRSTDTIITKLSRYCVQSGALTGAASISILIIIAYNSFEFPVLLPGVPYGSFYSLGLLASLLGRTALRESIPESESFHFDDPCITTSLKHKSKMLTQASDPISGSNPRSKSMTRSRSTSESLSAFGMVSTASTSSSRTRVNKAPEAEGMRTPTRTRTRKSSFAAALSSPTIHGASEGHRDLEIEMMIVAQSSGPMGVTCTRTARDASSIQFEQHGYSQSQGKNG